MLTGRNLQMTSASAIAHSRWLHAMIRYNFGAPLTFWVGALQNWNYPIFLFHNQLGKDPNLSYMISEERRGSGYLPLYHTLPQPCFYRFPLWFPSQNCAFRFLAFPPRSIVVFPFLLLSLPLWYPLSPGPFQLSSSLNSSCQLSRVPLRSQIPVV